MLRLTYASLATVNELFDFKKQGFLLEQFPGYTEDQWGIKAHNRPWIEKFGDFQMGQNIIEVGGAYSSLPRYLAKKYGLKAWIGDDFGEHTNESLWSRWGNPKELPLRFPDTKYVFERFGNFSESFPTNYFDRIFSVSTLEHIPIEHRLNVFRDMNRCMASDGLQIHAIDIGIPKLIKKGLYSVFGDKYRFLKKVNYQFQSQINGWIEILKQSGIQVDVKIPNSIRLYDRATLVESPDVVFRFYPPMNSPKNYRPGASLLLVIKKQ